MNRQQMREDARRREKARAALAHETKARILGFKVNEGSPTLTVDLQCECGQVSRMNAVQPPGEFARNLSKLEPQSGGSVTGEWSMGGCPNCGRPHRVRATMVVIVEEDQSHPAIAKTPPVA